MKYQVFFKNSKGKKFWLKDCETIGTAFGIDSDFSEGWKVIKRHIDAMNDLKIIQLKEKYGKQYDEEKAKKSAFKSYYTRMNFNEDMSEIIIDVGSWSEFYIFKKIEETEENKNA